MFNVKNDNYLSLTWSNNFHKFNLNDKNINLLLELKIEKEDIYLVESCNHTLTKETLKSIKVDIEEYNNKNDICKLYTAPKVFLYKLGEEEKSQEKYGEFVMLHQVYRNNKGFIIINYQRN